MANHVVNVLLTGSKSSSVDSSLQSTASQIERVGTTAKKSSSGLRNFSNTLDTIANHRTRLVVTLGEIVGGFKKLSTGMSTLVKDSVSLGARLDGLNNKFIILYKNKSLATDKMYKALSFAARTPFDVEQVVSAFAQFKAIGIEADKVVNGAMMIEHAANLAFGMGREMWEARQALQYAIKSNVWRTMQYKFASPKESIVEDAKARGKNVNLGTAEGREKAITDFIQNRFGGAMEKLSGTVSIQFQNLADHLLKFKKGIWDAVDTSAKAKNFLGKIVEDINSITPQSGSDTNKFGTKLAADFATFIDKGIDALAAGYARLSEDITDSMTSDQRLSQFIQNIGSAVSTVVSILSKEFGKIDFSPILNSLGSALASVINAAISSSFKMLWQTFKQAKGWGKVAIAIGIGGTAGALVRHTAAMVAHTYALGKAAVGKMTGNFFGRGAGAVGSTASGYMSVNAYKASRLAAYAPTELSTMAKSRAFYSNMPGFGQVGRLPKEYVFPRGAALSQMSKSAYARALSIESVQNAAKAAMPGGRGSKIGLGGISGVLGLPSSKISIPLTPAGIAGAVGKALGPIATGVVGFQKFGEIAEGWNMDGMGKTLFQILGAITGGFAGLTPIGQITVLVAEAVSKAIEKKGAADNKKLIEAANEDRDEKIGKMAVENMQKSVRGLKTSTQIDDVTGDTRKKALAVKNEISKNQSEIDRLKKLEADAATPEDKQKYKEQQIQYENKIRNAEKDQNYQRYAIEGLGAKAMTDSVKESLKKASSKEDFAQIGEAQMTQYASVIGAMSKKIGDLEKEKNAGTTLNRGLEIDTQLKALKASQETYISDLKLVTSSYSTLSNKAAGGDVSEEDATKALDIAMSKIQINSVDARKKGQALFSETKIGDYGSFAKYQESQSNKIKEGLAYAEGNAEQSGRVSAEMISAGQELVSAVQGYETSYKEALDNFDKALDGIEKIRDKIYSIVDSFNDVKNKIEESLGLKTKQQISTDNITKLEERYKKADTFEAKDKYGKQLGDAYAEKISTIEDLKARMGQNPELAMREGIEVARGRDYLNLSNKLEAEYKSMGGRDKYDTMKARATALTSDVSPYAISNGMVLKKTNLELDLSKIELERFSSALVEAQMTIREFTNGLAGGAGGFANRQAYEYLKNTQKATVQSSMYGAGLMMSQADITQSGVRRYGAETLNRSQYGFKGTNVGADMFSNGKDENRTAVATEELNRTMQEFLNFAKTGTAPRTKGLWGN